MPVAVQRVKLFLKGILIVLVLLLGLAKLFIFVSLEPLLALRDLNYLSAAKIERILHKGNFGFAVVADPRTSQIAFKRVIERINADSGISFVVVGGDITSDSTRLEYALFLRLLRELNKPVVVIPGNHDIRGCGRALFYRIFGPFYLKIEAGDRLFVFLDDSEKKHPFPFELGWLRNVLSSSNASLKFVFMHIPIYDPRFGNRMGHSIRDPEYASLLYKLFENYKVSGVFCSHIHSFYEGRWGDLRFFITGGGGPEKSLGNPHFLKVEVSGDSYNVVKINVPMENWERSLDEFISEVLVPMGNFVDKDYIPTVIITLLLVLLI